MSGNMKIKEAQKYGTYMRKEITKRILKEYKVMKEKDPDGMTFATYMLKVLTDAGFKAPDGSPLTLRGVRYQVLRSGISFRGARMRTTTPTLEVDPTPVKRHSPDKQEILQSLSKIPSLLKTILTDSTVTPEQRVRLVAAWFELQK